MSFWEILFSLKITFVIIRLQVHSGSTKRRLCHRELGACVLLLQCQGRLCSTVGRTSLCLHGQVSWAQAASDTATAHGTPFVHPLAAKPCPWMLTGFGCWGVTCTAGPAHSWANTAHGCYRQWGHTIRAYSKAAGAHQGLQLVCKIPCSLPFW